MTRRMARPPAPPVLPLYEPRELFQMPVSYLPSQIDGGATTTPLNFRDSPFRLLAADIWLVASLILWVPHIFMPLKSTNTYSELYPSRANIRDLFIHVWLGTLGILSLIVAIPLGIVAPGGAFAIFIALYCGLVWLLCWPLRGPRVVNSAVVLEGVDVKPEENWVFVNGVTVGEHWLQANVDMLSSIFKRPIVGIHNRTFGVVFDLMECLIQRCFSYSTEDTRIMYQHLKSILMDPKITKVVVIAHSQGGIILSTALDSLFADLPCGAFDKLEIYTFGCAANHFNNPVRFTPTTGTNTPPPANPKSPATISQICISTPQDPTSSGSSDTPPREERLIRHVEHYANEHDFVSRFGVLFFARDKLSNRFVGKVFMNKGHGGHLLNQHYLDHMFVNEASGFLDQVVDIDETTAVSREEAAGVEGDHNRTAANTRSNRGAGTAHGEPRVETGASSSASVRPELERVATGASQRSNFCYTKEARKSIDFERGKTVRALSRLWKYKNGNSPED